MSFIKTYGRCYLKFDNDPIIKTDPTYTAPTAKSNLSYTGNAQSLLNAGTTSDGTILYSENGTDWSTDIPSGTNAGSYTLYWKLVGDTNHNDVVSASIVVSVAKVNPTYTAPTGKENLLYTGGAQALLNAGSTNDGIIKYSLDGTNWGTSVPTGTEAQTYTVYWKLEGDANHNDITQDTISVEIASAAPTVEFVDLGLPSGLLWCNHNVGAESEAEIGLYFAWGETTGYADAAARNTALGGTDGFGYLSYANGDASSISANLSLAQDAANAYMGGDWRMPTKAECEELKENCNTMSIRINGADVFKFVSKINGKYILIPKSNFINGIDISGNSMYIWTSTYKDSSKAYDLYELRTDNDHRYWGMNIRAVREAPKAVDLGLPSGRLWADRNVGATAPEADGLYFAWGNVTGHKSTNGSTFDDSYDWGTANTGPYASTPGASIQFTSQHKNADYSATSGYDAARENLGGSWRMPTATEFQELYGNTDNEWTSINGVYGRKFMKKSDHSVYVFFPAAGYGLGTSLNFRESLGRYWSSSLTSADIGYSLGLDSSDVRPQNSSYRFNGMLVRAVQDAA